MDKRINNTIERYIKLISSEYANIEKVYLFGSHVKGNSYQDSDIDVALVFKELDDSKRFDIQVQLMILASQIDTRIEPHPISHHDFYSENPFAIEIRRTGIEIIPNLSKSNKV